MYFRSHRYSMGKQKLRARKKKTEIFLCVSKTSEKKTVEIDTNHNTETWTHTYFVLAVVDASFFIIFISPIYLSGDVPMNSLLGTSINVEKEVRVSHVFVGLIFQSHQLCRWSTSKLWTLPHIYLYSRQTCTLQTYHKTIWSTSTVQTEWTNWNRWKKKERRRWSGWKKRN